VDVETFPDTIQKSLSSAKSCQGISDPKQFNCCVMGSYYAVQALIWENKTFEKRKNSATPQDIACHDAYSSGAAHAKAACDMIRKDKTHPDKKTGGCPAFFHDPGPINQYPGCFMMGLAANDCGTYGKLIECLLKTDPAVAQTVDKLIGPDSSSQQKRKETIPSANSAGQSEH
jgi:hypothetical protein